MHNSQTKLKDELLQYLEGVNKSNFTKKYDGIIDIVLKYRDIGMTKQEVLVVVDQLGYIEMDDYKEDVFLELSNCLYGYCASSKDIEW
jgi:hypothetical protein